MIESKKNKYQITYSQILDSMLFLSILMAIVAAHTILDDICKIIFIGIVFLLRLKKTNKVFNIYFLLEVVFILYCYFQVKLGIVIDEYVAMSKVKTLLISLMYYLAIYMYILGSCKNNRIIEILVKATFYGLMIVLLCDFKNIFTGRFGTNANAGIYIMGIRIGFLNSTFIGHISGIALYLSLVTYWKENKYKAILFTLFFTSTILISGTRKVLIIIVVALITIPYLFDERKNFNKLVTRVSIILIVILIGYKLIMDIPILYNSIGVRIESVTDVILNGSTDEASFNTRQRLIKKGMDAFQQKRNFGWGLDNFKYVINDGGYYAHNNFVEILVSGGVVGFLIYYLKYTYLIVLTFTCKKRKSKDDYNRIKAIRIFVMTLIILEYWQVTYYYRLFMLPFIIALAYCYKSDKGNI